MNRQLFAILRPIEKEENGKDIYYNHRLLVEDLKKQGLPEREAKSKAWDAMLEQALEALR